MTTIETERLVLRSLEASDAARIAELVGDRDVARMTGRVPWPYSQKDAERWIARTAEEKVIARAIEHDGMLIGCIGFSPRGEGRGELGYWIGKPYWGQGYASEAVGAMLEIVFADPKIELVRAGHFADNPASGRVLSKHGFVFAGIRSLWSEARKLEVSTLDYELTRARWQRRRDARGPAARGKAG